MLRVNCVQKKNVYNCHGRTSLTNPTCSLSGLFKVFHQSREQHTKAESHTKVDWVTNRSWNTHDPWPRTILETLSGEALLVVLFFNHFISHRYRPDVSVEWHDQWEIKPTEKEAKHRFYCYIIGFRWGYDRLMTPISTGSQGFLQLWLRLLRRHSLGSSGLKHLSRTPQQYGIAEKPATRSSSCVGIKMMSVL